MDFLSRGTRAPAPEHHQPATHSVQPVGKPKKRIDWVARTVRFELFIVIVGSALIIAALALWLATGNYKNAESSYVVGDRYQAVFLTNNQVYFGKITDLNNKFIVLKDVFYIEPPSQTQASTNTTNQNYTLRKLGTSELHSPEDEMVINREQVTFWENLKDSSQVVTKIKEYKKNPDAANQSGDSSSSGSNTQQSSGTDQPSGSNP